MWQKTVFPDNMAGSKLREMFHSPTLLVLLFWNLGTGAANVVESCSRDRHLATPQTMWMALSGRAAEPNLWQQHLAPNCWEADMSGCKRAEKTSCQTVSEAIGSWCELLKPGLCFCIVATPWLHRQRRPLRCSLTCSSRKSRLCIASTCHDVNFEECDWSAHFS